VHDTPAILNGTRTYIQDGDDIVTFGRASTRISDVLQLSHRSVGGEVNRRRAVRPSETVIGGDVKDGTGDETVTWRGAGTQTCGTSRVAQRDGR
jgi:hypothetical protein